MSETTFQFGAKNLQSYVSSSVLRFFFGSEVLSGWRGEPGSVGLACAKVMVPP